MSNVSIRTLIINNCWWETHRKKTTPIGSTGNRKYTTTVIISFIISGFDSLKMSAVFDEREEYLKSPYFKKHIYSDFSPFYITVTICAIVGLSIFILNFVLGCCSRHSNYWNDRHTGKLK